MTSFRYASLAFAPLLAGCSAIASATSFTKHHELSANGDLGQLYAVHGYDDLRLARLPMPGAKYRILIARHDAYDEQCTVGLQSSSLRPMNGVGFLFPMPDERCSGGLTPPKLDFVDASCGANQCEVSREPGDGDDEHIALTVTLAAPGDATLAVRVRRRDTGVEYADQFVIKSRRPEWITLLGEDPSLSIAHAVPMGVSLSWCMKLMAGDRTVEITEDLPWNMVVDGDSLSLHEAIDSRGCVSLDAIKPGRSSVHVRGGGIGRDLTVQTVRLSDAVRMELYTKKGSFQLDKFKNDIGDGPVGEIFSVHDVVRTQDTPPTIWDFDIVPVLTFADGTTALGGASAVHADRALLATNFNLLQVHDSVFIYFNLRPVKNRVSGNLTADVGAAHLVYPLTIHPESDPSK